MHRVTVTSFLYTISMPTFSRHDVGQTQKIFVIVTALSW